MPRQRDQTFCRKLYDHRWRRYQWLKRISRCAHSFLGQAIFLSLLGHFDKALLTSDSFGNKIVSRPGG